MNTNKYLLCALLFSASALEAKPVLNTFTNGANITEKEAMMQRDDLSSIFGGAGIAIIPNTTEGKFSDLFELIGYDAKLDEMLYQPISDYLIGKGLNGSALRTALDISTSAVKTMEDIDFIEKTFKASAETIQKNPLKFAIAGYVLAQLDPSGKYISDLAQKGVDVWVFLDEVSSAVPDAIIYATLNAVSNESSAGSKDISVAIQSINALIKEGKAINMIAFGGGNELVDRTLQSVNGIENVDVLGISTPTNYKKSSPGGGYINLLEDVVLIPFDDWENVFVTNHNKPQKVLSAMMPHTKMTVNLGLYRDMFGHDLFKAYLRERLLTNGTVSKSYIMAHDGFAENVTALSKIPSEPTQPPYSYDSTISLGDRVDGRWLADEMSEYAPDNYARVYTLKYSSCRKLHLELNADVGSRLYLRTNGVIVGSRFRDSAGKVAFEESYNGGTYQIEVVSHEPHTKGSYDLQIVDKGACKRPQSSNIYLAGQKLLERSVEAGTEVEARVRVSYAGNMKNSTVPNPFVAYVLSKDTRYDDSDQILEDDASSVGSDDRYDDENERLTIPKDTMPGQYYILFVADYKNTVTESNENDNVKYSSLNVTAQVKDDAYISYSKVYDKSLRRGQSVKVKANVCYKGSKTRSALGKVYTGYYLVGSDYTKLLGSDTSTIGSNDTCDIEKEYIRIPKDAPKGSASILIFADYKKQLNESNKANNAKIIKVSIR